MPCAADHVAPVQHDAGQQSGAEFGARQRSGKINDERAALHAAVSTGEDGVGSFPSRFPAQPFADARNIAVAETGADIGSDVPG